MSRKYPKCVTAYFTVEQYEKIKGYCLTQGVESEAEFLRAAVTKYFESSVAGETLVLQFLKSLESKVENVRDMVDVSFEYGRLSHRQMLAYHEEIPAALKEAAQASAVRREEGLFNLVRESLRQRGDFFERLLHQYYQSEGNVEGGRLDDSNDTEGSGE